MDIRISDVTTVRFRDVTEDEEGNFVGFGQEHRDALHEDCKRALKRGETMRPGIHLLTGRSNAAYVESA